MAKGRRGWAVALAGLLVTAGLLAWRARSPTAHAPDPNAVPVTAAARLDPAALGEQLQAQAEASAFRLRIDARPRVLGNRAELLLENPAENTLSLSVTITLEDGGEALYESGPLAPGTQVLAAELTRSLPPGEHPATALFTAHDPETGEPAGNPARVDLILAAENAEQGPEPGQSPEP